MHLKARKKEKKVIMRLINHINAIAPPAPPREENFSLDSMNCFTIDALVDNIPKGDFSRIVKLFATPIFSFIITFFLFHIIS